MICFDFPAYLRPLAVGSSVAISDLNFDIDVRDGLARLASRLPVHIDRRRLGVSVVEGLGLGHGCEATVQHHFAACVTVNVELVKNFKNEEARRRMPKHRSRRWCDCGGGRWLPVPSSPDGMDALHRQMVYHASNIGVLSGSELSHRESSLSVLGCLGPFWFCQADASENSM